MNTTEWLTLYARRLKDALDTIPHRHVERVISIITETACAQRQIFICGNGGSAATASHFAVDLGKCASDSIKGASSRFKVFDLSANTPWITAIANDAQYSRIFVDQLQNYAKPGDILFALSTSGNSLNVVSAVNWAASNSLRTISLIGSDSSCALAKISELPIAINDSHCGRVEDAHMVICHMICYAFVEKVANFVKL